LIFFGETQASGVAAAENKGRERRSATDMKTAITVMAVRS
jgi:hypothetical protein